MSSTRSSLDHRLFQIGVAIKGLDGLIELVGGLLLLIFGPRRINSTLGRLALEHPWLGAHVHSVSPNSVHLVMAYLFFQGVIKLWLAEALLRERKWVFPVALVLLGLLTVSLIVEFFIHHSVGAVVLFVLNLIIMVLIWREYSNLRK